MNKDIADLSNHELLQEYSYCVKQRHYDPVDSMEPTYNMYELEDEIKHRMIKGGYR